MAYTVSILFYMDNIIMKSLLLNGSKEIMWQEGKFFGVKVKSEMVRSHIRDFVNSGIVRKY